MVALRVSVGRRGHNLPDWLRSGQKVAWALLVRRCAQDAGNLVVALDRVCRGDRERV